MAGLPWWQWVDGRGLVALTRIGPPRPRPRFLWTENVVPGISPYRGYQKWFGNTLFCAPVPKYAPDSLPADPYKAGRRLRATSMETSTYWPTFNWNQYNLATHVVDTSKPEGPVSEGGGGYTWQKVYQRFQSEGFRTKRGGGTYQTMTNRVPLPINMYSAPGTDASASVLDSATFQCIDYWQMKMSDGTHKWADGSRTWNSETNSYTYHDMIPAGSWGYITCGKSPDTRVSNGAFPAYHGNVVASGFLGMALQIGIDEALLAVGKKRLPDGTIVADPRGPVIDAIQHVIGIELAIDVAEPGWSWPATFSDGWGAPPAEMKYGQRLYFDPAMVNLDDYAHPFLKALVWTGMVYGFYVTDRGGNFAFRCESLTPDFDQENVWWQNGPVFENATYRNTIQAMPWDYLRSMPVDYGKPGTASAGAFSPMGIPS